MVERVLCKVIVLMSNGKAYKHKMLMQVRGRRSYWSSIFCVVFYCVVLFLVFVGLRSLCDDERGGCYPLLK